VCFAHPCLTPSLLHLTTLRSREDQNVTNGESVVYNPHKLPCRGRRQNDVISSIVPKVLSDGVNYRVIIGIGVHTDTNVRPYEPVGITVGIHNYLSDGVGVA